jgi:hypothetical protein
VVKVDEYARILRAHYVDGLSIKALARQFHHSRRKIREILGTAEPKRYIRLNGPPSHTVRASSVIENLNSRLRSYFFLRRHLGPDYLALLQFFLNHRRFLRSEHPERVGKSPAELLSGQSHPHWLQMLGFTLFSRN